jgi:hypothetical protein
MFCKTLLVKIFIVHSNIKTNLLSFIIALKGYQLITLPCVGRGDVKLIIIFAYKGGGRGADF